MSALSSPARRGSRKGVLLLVSAALLAFVVPPSHATGTYVRHIATYPDRCQNFGWQRGIHVDTHGADRTFANCDKRSESEAITYMDTVQGHLRLLKTSYKGDVFGTTVDDTGTYVAIGQWNWQSNSGYRLYLGKRNTDGTFASPRFVGFAGGTPLAMVAQAGKWWMVWPDSKSKWLQARTFSGASGRPERAQGLETMPTNGLSELSWNADGDGVAAVWNEDSQMRLGHASAKTGVWSSVPVRGAEGQATDLAVDGKTSYIGFMRTQKAGVVTNGSDGRHWSRVPLPSGTNSSWGAKVAAWRGHVWIMWNQVVAVSCSSTAADGTCRGAHNDTVARVYSLDLKKTWDLTRYVPGAGGKAGTGQSAMEFLNHNGPRARAVYQDFDQHSLTVSAEVGRA